MPESMQGSRPPTNLAGTDPAQDDRAAKWVDTRLAEFRAARTALERDWVDCFRAYKLLKTRQWYNGRSDLVLPHIRNYTERLVQRIAGGLVGKDDFFDILPTKPVDHDKAAVVKEVLKLQMEKEGYRRKIPLLVRDAIIYGTAIKKVRWTHEVRTTATPIYRGDQFVMDDTGPRFVPVYEAEAKPRVLKDGPCGDRIDIFNIFVDPKAQDFADTDVVEVMVLSASEVNRLVETGVFAKGVAAQAMQFGGNVQEPDYSDRKSLRDTAMGVNVDAKTKQAAHYTYKEYWGEYPLQAGTDWEARTAPTIPCVIGILAEKYVVRLEANPFLLQQKPYFKACLVEIPGQFYGESLVKAALPQWQELNDCRNQANDARTFAVNPVLLRGPGNADKRTSHRIFPGAIITGANLQFAAFPDTTAAAFRAEMQMTREMEETFAAPGIYDAQSNSSSATEAAIEREEASSRLLGYVKSFEETMVKPELDFRLGLCRQYLTTEDKIRMKGPHGLEWRPFTRADFLVDYDMVTLASTQMQSRASLTAQFAATTDRMLAQEQFTPGMFDWVRWWDTFFRDGLGIEHASLYIKPLKFAGRVPTPEEVHIMLSNGQRVDPDPRQDFATTLPLYAAFIAENAGRMPADMRDLFLEHLRAAVAKAQEQLIMKQAMMMQAMSAQAGNAQKPNGEPGASPAGGGRSNKPVGEEDRDGKGLQMGRQLMKAQPAGRDGA